MKKHVVFVSVLFAVSLLSLFVPYLFGAYWTLVALNLAMWIALTQSWTLFSGMTGYISLGHVVFYGLGAYVVATSFKTMSLWLSVPLGGLVAGLFACVVAHVLTIKEILKLNNVFLLESMPFSTTTFQHL